MGSLRLYGVFALLSLIVPLIGGLYAYLHIPQIEEETFSSLSVIARLNARHIEDWMREREGDLEVLMRSPNVIDLAEQASPNSDPVLREKMSVTLGAVRQAYRYKSVSVLNTKGEVVLDAGDTDSLITVATRLFPKAEAGAWMVHSEIAIGRDGDPALVFVGPLIKAQGESHVLVGYVVIGASLQQDIFPHLQLWPTPSPSGESFLVRRDHDAVDYLSALRFVDENQPRPRVSVTQTDSPAVSAVLHDTTGVISGIDYRDVPVLAAYRPVAGTTWNLIAKVDRAEVLAPMWRTMSWIGLIALASVLTIASVLFALWRQRERAQQFSLMAEQAKADQLLHHFFNLPFVGMVIVSAETRRFVRFNDQTCVITGYSREEMTELTWQDLTHPDDFEHAYAEVKRIGLGEVDAVAFEQRLMRKDGSVIFIIADVKGVRRPDGRLDYLIGTAQDITQRKMHAMAINVANAQLKANQAELKLQNDILFKAKAELEESRSQYVSLYEFAPAAYLTLSLKGEIRRINNTGVALLGYCREKDGGRDFATFVAADELNRWAAFLEQATRNSDRQSDEFALRHEDGSVFYVNAESSLQAPLSDAPLLRMTLTDITARRLAERALRRSMESYEAVTQSSNDAIVNANSDGLIMSWNPRAESIFGYSAVEAIGRSLDMLIPERYRDVHNEGMRRAFADGGSQVLGKVIELTALRKDGKEFDVDLSLTRWEISEGIYFTATLRDISQRKKTEQSLRILSEAVRQSPEAIAITDTEARIEYVNEAFVMHTGYRLDEVIGQNPHLLNSGKTPVESFTAMWEALKRGEAWKGEFYNKRKDGTEFVEFANVAPIRQTDGRITHYVAVKEDITEKKRLGVELDKYRYHLEEVVEQRTAELAKASLRAETANIAKSAFLANMSHEIRTPMNAIVGLTHLLRSSEPTPRQLERLEKIETSAAHLLELINNILDLSKIEADKMELEEVDFRLDTIFESVRTMLANQSREKRLPVVIDLENVPLWLRGDPTRLRQALLNYAANAVKFTAQGQIILRARLLEEADDEVLLRFEVEDSGIGIPTEKLGGLFQSFEQADASTTRKYGGTGLGLAITSRLAKLMGGEVGVYSEFQRGSTFWLTARLKRGLGIMSNVTVDRTTNHEEMLRRHYAGSRILVADDVDVNLEVAQLLLHGVGLQVDSAQNGREAVDKARITAYNLILMDVQMPVMSGLAATRAIRQMSGRAQTPILAMTANAFEEDRRSCIDSGMNDFVSKPVDPETLYALLIKWLPRTDGTQADEVVGEPLAAPEVVPPAPKETPLRERLVNVPGLDVENGLARVRGSEDKFERVIDLFLRGHESDAERIGIALSADGFSTAEQLAHALKGSAGLIGATTVAELATALLNAIRTKAGRESVEAAYADLRAPLRALIAGLKTLRHPENDISSGAPDMERCKLVLSHLERLLEDGDMEAVTFAREESALLKQALGDAAAAIQLTIQNFDYAQALAELRASSGHRALLEPLL